MECQGEPGHPASPWSEWLQAWRLWESEATPFGPQGLPSCPVPLPGASCAPCPLHFQAQPNLLQGDILDLG